MHELPTLKCMGTKGLHMIKFTIQQEVKRKHTR